MKKDTVYIQDTILPVSYTITMNLRYAPKEIDLGNGLSKKELRLQQMWRGSDGSEKWEWIEELTLKQ